jgi:hypothetical protein
VRRRQERDHDGDHRCARRACEENVLSRPTVATVRQHLLPCVRPHETMHPARIRFRAPSARTRARACTVFTHALACMQRRAHEEPCVRTSSVRRCVVSGGALTHARTDGYQRAIGDVDCAKTLCTALGGHGPWRRPWFPRARRLKQRLGHRMAL